MSKEKIRNSDNSTPAPKQSGEQSVQFKDNRPQTALQLKQQELADSFSKGKSNPIQKKKNSTGMPDNLKQGIEQLSGHSLDDVKVHYNSGRPAQLHAHAYAQGTNIHLGPGQEKHLPHEAWHVVQQKQGRVKPTRQMKGANVNDDKGLENEADVMGAKAMQFKSKDSKHESGCGCPNCNGTAQLKKESHSIVQQKKVSSSEGVIQRAICSYCGWEGSHKPGCTPEKRAAAKNTSSQSAPTGRYKGGKGTSHHTPKSNQQAKKHARQHGRKK